jgi:hypothetical protein
MNSLFRNNTNINNVVGGTTMFSAQLAYLILVMTGVALLIVGLVHLVKVAQQCLETTGYYEAFESPPPPTGGRDAKEAQLKAYIQKAARLNTILEADVDTFTENIQDVCDVYAQVGDIYVENNSGPRSESEYSLPKATLDALLSRRRTASKQRFLEARSIYGQSQNTPVYECFTNPPPATRAELEDDLRTELVMLETKLQNIVSGSTGNKFASVGALQKFNEKYITKTAREMTESRDQMVEGYAPAAPAAPAASPPPAVLSMTGATLLAHADTVLQKAEQVHTAIVTQRDTAKKQLGLVEELKSTTSRLETGNITGGDVGVR